MPSAIPPDPQESPSPARAIAEVWDLPIRIFHWLMVALVVTAVISGKTGGNAMEIHLQAGYGIVILLAFRLLWGFFGTTHARFANFVCGIPAVLTYCRQLHRGTTYAWRGHNPLGGWMVLAMLAGLTTQGITGLFADDELGCEGPLAGRLSQDMSDYLTAVHKLNFKVLAVLAAIHVAAIVYYQVVKRMDLLRPMITGRMVVEDGGPATRIPAYSNLLAVALLTLVTIGFFLLVPAA